MPDSLNNSNLADCLLWIDWMTLPFWANGSLMMISLLIVNSSFSFTTDCQGLLWGLLKTKN